MSSIYYILLLVIIGCVLYIVIKNISNLDQYDIKEYISDKLEINYDIISQFDIEEANDKVYIKANYYWIQKEYWKDSRLNELSIQDIDNIDSLEELDLVEKGKTMVTETIYLILEISNKTYKLYTTNIQLMYNLIDILNDKGMNIIEREEKVMRKRG